MESTRERGILASVVAPHLVRPLPFLTPLGTGAQRPLGWGLHAALQVSDVMRARAGTSRSLFPAPRRVSDRELLEWAPSLDAARFRGGMLHWDGQVEDDARLVVAVARTAAAFGARILTHCAAVDVGPGGATVVDELSGGLLDVRARTVVNATGVWAERIEPSVRLRPSRGTHVVVDAQALGHPRAAVSVAVPGSFGRVVFALPRPDGLVLLGLTDDPTDEVTLSPQAEPTDIAFLLQTFSSALEVPLGPDDVVATTTGLRPLVDAVWADAPHGDRSPTADLSRNHVVLEREGVITVVGGKLTTYRRMAADVVDRLTRRPCLTHAQPLVGAGDVTSADRHDLPERLLRRFGTEASTVAERGAVGLMGADLVHPDAPVLHGEVVWAREAEGAVTDDDLLDGRLRLDLTPEWRRAVGRAVRGHSRAV